MADDSAQTTYEGLHANIDKLWDAIALLEGALAHEDMKNHSGAQRIVRIATDKLRELDGILSPLV